MHKVELHTSSHYNACALTHLHLKKPMADNRNNEKIKPVLEYNASADILSTYPLCFMISLPSLPPSPSLGAI